MYFRKKRIILLLIAAITIGILSPVVSASLYSITNAIVIGIMTGDEGVTISPSATALRVEIRGYSSSTTDGMFFLNLDNAEWANDYETIITAAGGTNGDRVKLERYSDTELAVKIMDGIDEDLVFTIPLYVKLKAGEATVEVYGNEIASPMAPVVFAKAGAYKLSITSGHTHNIYDDKTMSDITISETVRSLINLEGTVEIVFKMKNNDWKFGGSDEYVSVLDSDVQLTHGFAPKQASSIIQVRTEEDASAIRFKIEGNLLDGSLAPGRIIIKNIPVIPQATYSVIKSLEVDMLGNSSIVPQQSFTWEVNRPQLKLSYITISNGILNPSFSPDTNDYNITVENNVSSIDINGVAMSPDTNVVGGGKKDLQVGTNTIQLDVVESHGCKNTYTIIITRKSASIDSGSSSSGGGGYSPAPVTVNQIISNLTDKDKQYISKKVEAELPYTSINTPLTVELLKQLTDGKFTDKQLQEMLEKPELFKDLGIDIVKLNKQVTLTPIKDVQFKDMPPRHWASDSIKKVAELGLVAGMPSGDFKPSESLQIADTFTFLDRVLLLNNIREMKLPRSTVEKYITNKEHWAFASIASIGSKLSEKTLALIAATNEDSLSRELLAQVLYELTKGKLPETQQSISFKDIEESPYREAIEYCNRVGLLNGTGENQMLPKKALTRAELMIVVMKLNDKL
jgi:hypothetical protein